MADGSSPSLSGRGVLVTGGSSGIGRAIVLAMARAGANVALTYRQNETGAREVEREVVALGRRAAVFQVNLTNDTALGTLGVAARDELGGLHVWVNNAGADVLTGAEASRPTIEKLDLLLAVDLRGTMVASWSAADLFLAQAGGGVIINMSWDHALAGMAGTNPQLFAAVKGGVLAFSKSLAKSLAPRVRVNVIAPGWIETSFGAGLDEERRREVAESTPLGRWGTPDDVAGAAVFLASDAASFVTGQVIAVGGGLVM